MKGKIKTWQIFFASIFAIMIAAITSSFCLRANTVDEETGEIITDNWKIDLVFYDSTVDNGKTPLPEIVWDATDDGFEDGEERVITVQINYKNDSTETTYEPGELELVIPNLIYYDKYKSGTARDAQWETSVIVGANDKTHTNYDWNFITAEEPSEKQQYFTFNNAKKIEAKANLEGCIQIVYTIMPTDERPESPLDSCLHTYNINLQAILKNKIYETTITSPNWPENYPDNMKDADNTWEFQTDKDIMSIYLEFNENSKTADSSDQIRIYNSSKQLNTLWRSDMAGKKYDIEDNYVKIAMRSNSSGTAQGFSVDVFTKSFIASSNELPFSYSRTYPHPWQKRDYTIEKEASKIVSLDGFPTGDYYWVKYTFTLRGNLGSSYPYMGAKYYIEDTFPSECVVLDYAFNPLTLENGYYKDSEFSGTGYSSVRYEYVYVGYPKSIYNEAAGNLDITNHIDLYIKYDDTEEYIFEDDAEISLNLADFEFSYEGNLYSVTKSSMNKNNGKFYSQFMLDPLFSHFCGYCKKGHARTIAYWKLDATAIYTGTPMTVRVGDDLLYITDSNNNYRKLNEDEYYFTKIYFPEFKNMNGIIIDKEKYPMSLYVKYKDETGYVFYQTLTGRSSVTVSFEEIDKKVTGFYLQAEDLQESFIFTQMSVYTEIKPKGNISDAGIFYNFGYVNVFSKDENGNLALLNEPTLDSYQSTITKEEIATFDQNIYGHYMQRSESSCEYYKFVSPDVAYQNYTYKDMEDPIQDIENEKFWITTKLGTYLYGDYEFHSVNEDPYYLQQYYFNNIDKIKLITKFSCYDLLPKGLESDITAEKLLDTISIKPANIYTYFYLSNGEKAFESNDEFADFIREHSTITITENFNGTGRTKIEWNADFSDTPLLHVYSYYIEDPSKTHLDKYYPCPYISFQTYVSYDTYMELGANYKNYGYSEMYQEDQRIVPRYIKDNGQYDPEFIDINNNEITDEYFAYANDQITITSVISAYQDVSTFVQTDYSNFDTNIVDASYNSEYQYKLRVRTGTANVTNLVIYSSIEEAQPTKTRWKGEFLGIDTSYAESKGYIVKVWYSENTTVDTLNKDSSWKEYSDTVDRSTVKSLAFEYLSSTATLNTNSTAAMLPANTLTYVLIKMKSPNDENETRLARMDCWTEWNALDDYDRPVDFITGINSNVVKVALPNSVKTDDMPSISLKFTKEITGITEAFENMNLNKTDNHIFAIRLTSLTANDNGTYNQVTGLLSSNTGLIISQIPIGTYLLEELGDNYFDFIKFTNNNDPEIIIEGVTFEKTDTGYIITVSEDLTENIEFNIKVTNEIEDERFFEDKNNEENLFLINKTGIDHNTPED